jgi:hypothetical protein
MVISRGPGWVVIGVTLVVVVDEVVVVDIVVVVSGAIEASISSRLDAMEAFEFCSSLHANKRLAPSSGRRKRNFI